MDLRTKEQLKIHCGKQHFKALDNGIDMRVTTDWKEVKNTL
jgi:type III restriction enzyme